MHGRAARRATAGFGRARSSCDLRRCGAARGQGGSNPIKGAWREGNGVAARAVSARRAAVGKGPARGRKLMRHGLLADASHDSTAGGARSRGDHSDFRTILGQLLVDLCYSWIGLSHHSVDASLPEPSAVWQRVDVVD